MFGGRGQIMGVEGVYCPKVFFSEKGPLEQQSHCRCSAIKSNKYSSSGRLESTGPVGFIGNVSKSSELLIFAQVTQCYGRMLGC
jgi:hypothetical protein